MEPSLSLLIAVQNAEQSLRSNVERWLELLPELTRRFEVLVVDDGSADHTSEVAADLVRQFPQVRFVRHEQPRGKEAAFATARQRAAGSVLVSIDDVANHLELRKRWEATIQPVLPKQPTPAIKNELTGLLSPWCEQANPSPAASARNGPPIKPPNFRSHLAQLSRGE